MKDKTNCKVKDHFHYIGEYRDPMDNIYYLKYIVPIGCNYDYHFFIKTLLQKNISYILKFIDTARFMANSLLHLVNNLSEGIHRITCKYGHDDKKCEICGIRYKYCEYFFEYTNFKHDLIEYECLCCNRNYQQSLMKS